MRILALVILTIPVISMAPPARAQTYGGGYPFCLRAHGFYYECLYTTLAQCNASASGRTAQCFINPYFASAEEPSGNRRQRRGY
jgi:hypothetical protein